MRNLTRYQLLLGAILLGGAVVLWSSMRRLRDIGACLDRGDMWDYSAHVCRPPINPLP